MNLFDESMISSYVQERIQMTVPRIHRAGHRWNFRCPVCGDSRKSMRKMRGNYYPKDNSYYCFNETGCACSGLWIVSKFEGRTIDEVKSDFIQWSRGLTGFGTPRSDARKEIDPTRIEPVKNETVSDDEFEIPDTWIDLPDNIRTMLVYRKIYDAPFFPTGDWKMYYDTESMRIVIPWMRNRRIVYWQSRAITKKQTPKYLFPPDGQKPVFGLDDIDDEYPYVFLHEGVFDSIFIKNGLAIGGKSLTDHQKEILSGVFPEKVMFFDNQWTDKAGYKESMDIAESDRTMPLFIWSKDVKCKDLNECAMDYPIYIEKLKDLDFVRSRIFRGVRALFELKM